MSHIIARQRTEIVELREKVDGLREQVVERGKERTYFKRLVRAQQKELDYWRKKDEKLGS